MSTDALRRVAQDAERQRELRRRADPRHARAIWQPRILLRHPGWIVAAASVLLALLGAYCIALTSGVDAGMLEGLARRQLVFVVIGIGAAACAAAFNYRTLPVVTPVLGALAVALLVFVLLPFVPESIVTPRKGARRWINLGIVDFQPSEFAKVVYVLVLASYLRFRENHRTWLGLLPPALIALIPMVLIIAEPDLGTAMVFLPALAAMLIAAGARLAHLLATGALALACAAAVVVASLTFAAAPEPAYPLLRPHQVERIQAVVDQATGDQRFLHDRGFQGSQAMTLVGAGGVAGHPAEKSRALVHFSRIPEPHNDMIFAVLTNRFGLLGAWTLLALYLLWIAGAALVAARCKDPFGRLVVVGFAAIVATQMFVNVGMTMGLLPITGMTLPFVSYGGSSLVMGFVMTGLVVGIAMRRAPYLWQPSFEFDEPNDD